MSLLTVKDSLWDSHFRLKHKDYGDMGSEFVIEHNKFKCKRFFISLVICSVLVFFIDDKISQEPIYLWITNGILSLLLVYKLHTKVTVEYFVVLPMIGLQIQKHYFLGKKSTTFLDISMIKNVIINEAISWKSVILYMAVLLNEGNSQNLGSVYPLFTHSWPTLRKLKGIYCITQRKMFSNTTKLKIS